MPCEFFPSAHVVSDPGWFVVMIKSGWDNQGMLVGCQRAEAEKPHRLLVTPWALISNWDLGELVVVFAIIEDGLHVTRRNVALRGALQSCESDRE